MFLSSLQIFCMLEQEKEMWVSKFIFRLMLMKGVLEPKNS